MAGSAFTGGTSYTNYDMNGYSRLLPFPIAHLCKPPAVTVVDIGISLPDCMYGLRSLLLVL